MYLYMHTTQQTEKLTYCVPSPIYSVSGSSTSNACSHTRIWYTVHHFNQINSSKISLLLPQVYHVGKVKTSQGIHVAFTCIREMAFTWTDTFAAI